MTRPWPETGWWTACTSPIIIQADETLYWGHSAALGLDLCWEEGQLRWWDPVAGRYLETQDEIADARIAAEACADTAEARLHELEAELERRRQS